MILDDLKGLKVLVTGGSSGIGAAVAKGFAAHGSRVALHYFRGREAAEKLAAEIAAAGGEAVLVSGDMSTSEGAASVASQAVAALGGLDTLVNNAGGLIHPQKLPDYADFALDGIIDLNVRSLLAATHAALPALKASDKASVINTGSIAGRNGGRPTSALYAAAKAAVHSLTRSMATEFAPDGIRANAVAPGLILTPFHEATPRERLEAVKSQIPLNRLGLPEECVGAFLFLASPAMSGYVTGIIVDVNGGRLMP